MKLKRTTRHRILTAILNLLFLTTQTSNLLSQEPSQDESMRRTLHAPELDKNLGWINTDRPLKFSNELKGRVVLLDFWTFCCINCMHIIPDLKFLEEKYKDQPFVVIGVHSAKFENEASRETIRA